MFETQRSYVDALRLAFDLTADLRIISVERDLDAGLERVEELSPDLVIAAHSPGSYYSGLEVVERLRGDHGSSTSALPVAILTSFPTPGIASEAKGHRGVSVLSTARPVTDLVTCLRCVIRGEQMFLGIQKDPFGLTRAEMEALELLTQGFNAQAMADQLHLSVHAIRARIRGVLQKTDSTSQLESVAKAVSSGIVAPPLQRRPTERH